MFIEVIKLLLSLVVILLCCELFTNGIEWLGKKLNLGDGVVGSIFSAVGTCLPETIIPVIAILFATDSAQGNDIGIGAILGAPFMLSTLAFFLTGLSVIVFRRRRKTGMEMLVNNKILGRDIGFFMLIYSIGVFSSFIPSQTVKYCISALLICCYIFYIILTVKSDSESNHALEPLYMSKVCKAKSTPMLLILIQLVIALCGIIFGAEAFVNSIEVFADFFKISPLALSLIIAPIATELPEKFNSIIWISKKKDTLAMGNITGAMVFQSCIPVAIGMMATPWVLDRKAFVSAMLALASALLTFTWIKLKGRLRPFPLLIGGVFYAAFITFLITTGFK